MRRIKNLKLTARVTSLFVLSLMVATGISLAALVSRPAKLSGSTIQTATAGLQISTDGVHYADTLPGFTFGHMIPGNGTGNTTGNFYLRNTGDVPLALKLALTSTPTNADHVDLSKVMISVNDVTVSGASQTFTMQSLLDGGETSGLILSPTVLQPGVSDQFHMYTSMSSDAMNGPSATIGNIDVAFSGVAQP